jgi:hypothetical protein
MRRGACTFPMLALVDSGDLAASRDRVAAGLRYRIGSDGGGRRIRRYGLPRARRAPVYGGAPSRARPGLRPSSCSRATRSGRRWTRAATRDLLTAALSRSSAAPVSR